jgi:cytochrome o ubiquinol oxidase operon protein cyoD
MQPHHETRKHETRAHETRSIAGHGTFATYLTGYAVAAIITMAIFYAVTFHSFSTNTTLVLIAAAAAIQSFAHMWFFLHMFRATTPVWNTLSFAFTLFVVVVLISGSLFILLSANYHMMQSAMPAAALP